MEKKYELTEETLVVGGHILHRIMALKDFRESSERVKKGDLGGFIEKESNLDHYGNCWIYNEAVVYGDAKIRDNAIVWDYADISGSAMVCENAGVFGHARIWGNARIYDNGAVYDNAKVYNCADVGGVARVGGNARICDRATVLDYATIVGNVKVGNKAMIHGSAYIGGDAVIESKSDYIVFKNWWSSGRYFTWTRSNDMWSAGCFYGTGEELIKKAYADSEEKGCEYERVVKYVESIKSEIK